MYVADETYKDLRKKIIMAYSLICSIEPMVKVKKKNQKARIWVVLDLTF